MAEIFLIDDEPSILLSVGAALKDAGHSVAMSPDGADAMDILSSRVFDVVISDVRLPGVDGLSILQHVRQHSPATDFVLMTAYGSVNDAVSALKDGAADYVTKPFSVDELLLRIDRVVKNRTLADQLRQARRWSDRVLEGELVGRSPSMVRLREYIDMFAANDAPVLISGESGTGKELVAAALHNRSQRQGKPFVAVNCAAFPETLLEAELFGHERGAFTGAVKKRHGRFKAADGGVLFLDEVAEMPMSSQAKLLRVLQERCFEPLGTNETVRVDVRVLSATHRKLKDWVAQGKFREDLYYRLKILELEVPPLRERMGDIPVLVEHFLTRFAADGRQTEVAPEALAALSAYGFPGNVRELQHAIQHALALALDAPRIEAAHLPADIVGRQVRLPPTAPERLRPLSDVVREFEREYLERALKLAGGSKTRTAEALGISRKNLWEKLRRHGLSGASSTLDEEPAPTGESAVPPAETRGPV